MPTKRRQLTDEVEREICALYVDSTTPVAELKQTYGLTNGLLYSVLKRNHVPARTVAQKATERRHKQFDVVSSQALVVTADKNGIVEHVERVKPARKTSVFEVSFTSAIRFDAEDIEDAIAQARRMPMCKRVYAVKLVGNDGL